MEKYYNIPEGGHNNCDGTGKADRLHCASVRALIALVESVADEFNIDRCGFISDKRELENRYSLTDGDAIIEIADCLQFLGPIHMNDEPNIHSYGLKHTVEDWNRYRYRRKDSDDPLWSCDFMPGIANGSMIAAALIHGAPCEAIDPKGSNPNMWMGLNHYDIRDRMIGTGTNSVIQPGDRCECCELPWPEDPCRPEDWILVI